MGMDVFGRNPVNEAGRYFRASIWQWPSIHAAMVRLCPDLLDAETLRLMESNDGAGPLDPGVCQEIARRMERWLQDPEFVDRTVASMVAVHLEKFDDAPGVGVLGMEAIASDELRELVRGFIGFLRHCGGFAVW